MCLEMRVSENKAVALVFWGFGALLFSIAVGVALDRFTPGALILAAYFVYVGWRVHNDEED